MKKILLTLARGALTGGRCFAPITNRPQGSRSEKQGRRGHPRLRRGRLLHRQQSGERQPKIQSEYEGAKYYFASAEHKKLFDAIPRSMHRLTAATAATRRASTVYHRSVRSGSRSSTADSSSNTTRRRLDLFNEDQRKHRQGRPELARTRHSERHRWQDARANRQKRRRARRL